MAEIILAQSFNELAFSPTMQEIVSSRPESKITIMTGANNSGKSAYLKKVVTSRDFLYVGVNRFYSFHHLPLHTENPSEVDQFFNNQQSTTRQKFQNFEGSFFNCSSAITRLSNQRRQVLFQTFQDLFGVVVDVRSEDDDNVFSNRFVSVDGESLSVTSSGTRLFLGLLAALMDERFSAVAIDEPELGLSPTLQRKLADIVVRGIKRGTLLPHNPHVVLSTHSHLFLDHETPQNNFVVSKAGNLITARPCKNVIDLHDIQFRLLGNDLSELYLPDIVIFVEGETDKIYLQKISDMYFERARVVIEACSGDIAKRLSFWTSSLGDMQLSPYRTRTIIIYDRVKQAGIEMLCRRVGLPDKSMIEWKGNGIEYVYPTEIIEDIFQRKGIVSADLKMDRDDVRYDVIAYKKMEPCRKVTERLNKSTIIPDELRQKFIDPILTLLGR